MSHVLPNISRGRFFEPIFTSKKFDLYTSIYGKSAVQLNKKVGKTDSSFVTKTKAIFMYKRIIYNSKVAESFVCNK